MDMYRRIETITRDTLRACVDAGAFTLPVIPSEVPVEKAKQPDYGDFATPVCLQLARQAHRSPRDMAKAFLLHLADPDGILDQAEVAGPGFINFTIRDDVWREALRIIGRRGADFGRSSAGAGERILVEIVSGLPVAPLHVGQGRGAVVGDAIASLLEAVGYDVAREYFIGDAGERGLLLGRSLFVRYQQAAGRDVDLPEDHVAGEYVTESAARFREIHGDALLDHDFDADPEPFVSFIRQEVEAGIREDLRRLDVRIDRWLSTRELDDAGRIERAVARLEERGHAYTRSDGSRWFRVETEGDPEDHLLAEPDGGFTWLAADIAYHASKFERGFDHCLNVWDADHQPYLARLRAALAALGIDPGRIEFQLYRLVRLVTGGQTVRTSARAGHREPLRALLDDIGEDVARCNFVMRRSEVEFDLDLDLARTHSLDNPVFYVQYGHARIWGVLERAREEGHPAPDLMTTDLSPLELPEELELIKKALEYPWIVRSAAESRSPHQVVFYLQDLIGLFHSYYTRYRNSERVVSDDAANTAARLALCEGLRIVLASALRLLGVTAPERMAFSE